MRKVAVFLLVVGLLFGGTYKYELTATIGGVKPEGNLDLEDALSYGARLGINLNDCMEDQIEIGFERSDCVSYYNSTVKTNISRYFIYNIQYIL